MMECLRVCYKTFYFNAILIRFQWFYDNVPFTQRHIMNWVTHH